MCGLLLSTRPRDPADPRWRRALQILECRGPDALGEVHATGVSAGHRRLAIIGLGEAGRQPCTDDADTDLLVFNGEIYNYRELGERYGIPAESDTRVLHAMLRMGLDDRLSELRGMFAFAYWRRSGDEVTVITARDFFGVKPLYVAPGADGSLAFASVASALVALDGGHDPDPVQLAGFLATGFFPAGASPFVGIEKCPEGVVTTWRRAGGGWTRSDAPLSLDPWPVLSVEDAVDDSVQAHLVSDVPVGVLLSGGIDSTLIAASAARRVEGLRTYSLTNPGNAAIDESEFARWNAAAIGAVHTEVPFNPAESLDTIRALVRSSGEPFGDPAFIPLATLCARVADDLKVVLAGEGADELFGGYRRYEVERFRERAVLRTVLRGAGRARGGTRQYLTSAPSQRTRTWASWAEPDDLLAHSWLLSAEWQAASDLLPACTSEALAQRQSDWSLLPASPRGLGLPPHRAYDLTQWLPNVFLEKSDRASMLHSVEVRVPFLDPVVARSSMTVRQRGTGKMPLRRALEQLVPTVRLPDRKMGLSVDARALVTSSGLGDYVELALHDPRSPLLVEGRRSGTLLTARAGLNPVLAFRLGLIGVWLDDVAHPSVVH
jgi:asparagine synthase (glutamine-hydrolysing)